ncbi:MAG: amidohydrolase [Thermoguttaceae bacterium]|nr:amidohydrolase [Thermoguttaceae bacterium]MDW8079458.1 amidohydrolase [Thermoguttaceae bacterium]
MRRQTWMHLLAFLLWLIGGGILVNNLLAPSVATAAETQPAPLAEEVQRLVQEVTPHVVQWRREIHAYPELGNREERTGQFVAQTLGQLGVDELRTGVAHHGVVALVRGKGPGPVIALRADMDALPVQEETGLPFASRIPGRMHACGHDAHTAMLLGAAAVLVRLRDQFPGAVKFIFQPAEEGTPPGEEGGAKLMIAQGVLENPKVDAIFGMHVNVDLPTGKIGYRPGSLMAAVDRFRVAIVGKQSHAAMPWAGIDPIVTASHVITAVQTIASRTIDAREPIVVSFGIIRGGEAWNIIPQRVELEGTIRTHNPQVRKTANEAFRRIVTEVSAAFGATAEIEMHDYGPAVWNDPKLLEFLKPALAQAVGAENLVELQPVMGGEDFAHYAQKVPGLYVYVGARNESIGAIYPVHTPQFRLDEAALPIGVKTHCLVALRFLFESQGTLAEGQK